MSTHNQPNAATRKRRSSILKTKPRAPFAELEFNPPTPDGASKSRRVSFSRRTAVAEFVFNEGTTTWRNVYEKQNRSLESSNNESDLGAPAAGGAPQPFHDVEAEMDCTTLGNPGGCGAGGARGNVTLFNDMNFTEQLASLDCMTSDNNLKAPTKNYEVSVMGEKSKMFADTFGDPLIVEHTGRIEVDFSMMQPVRPCGSDELDDLSDIAKDVERSIPSLVGPLGNDFNRSCYVEVDLNETKVCTSPPDICDMSITDTVQSPHVQAVSKNVEPPKKPGMDWIVDKENIVVQSFPKSSADRFEGADDNVLVFDGKKLKVANINDKLDNILSEPAERKNDSKHKLDTTNGLAQLTEDVLGCPPLGYERHFENVSQISLDRQNTNDSNVQTCSTDAPHAVRKNISHHMSVMTEMSLMGSCIENPTMDIRAPSMIEKSFSVAASTSLMVQDFDDGLTDIIESNVMKNAESKKGLNENEQHVAYVRKTICQPNVPKRKTIILNHDDDLPNFTLDVPPQFDQSALKGSQKGIVYDTEESVASMSTTQAILREIQEASDLFKCTSTEDKRKTIVLGHDNTMSDLSLTQGVPVKDIQEDKENINKLSMNQMEEKHTITQEKRQTILFDKENDNANMSMTQAIPQNVLDEEKKKRQTFVCEKENDNANMSMTQAIPSRHIMNQEKRQTIIFDKENDNANMSVTQAIPSRHIMNQEKRQTIIFDKENDNANMSVTQAIPSRHIMNQEKRQTIIFDKENDNANMSVTQAIPSRHIMNQEKRQTIIFDKENDNANMSVTQAIPQNILDEVNRKRQTLIFDKENDNARSVTSAIPSTHIINQGKQQTIIFNKENDNANMSMTQAIPQNILDEVSKKREAFVHDKENDNTNMSMTQAIPSKHITQEKQLTIVFDKDNANMSMTEAIPKSLLYEVKRKTLQMDENDDLPQLSMTPSIKPPTDKWRATLFEQMSDLSVVPAAITNKRSTITLERRDEVDMSMTHAVKNNVFDQGKSSTIASGNNGGISMTHIPHKVVEEKGKTIVFDNDNMADMSITQAILQKASDEKRKTIVFDKHDDMAEMSITQAIPQKVSYEKRKTNVFDTHDDMANMLITQAIQHEKDKTIVFDKHDDMADISILQAIPHKLNSKNIHQTTVVDEADRTVKLGTVKSNPQNKSEEKCEIFYESKDRTCMSTTKIALQNIVSEEKRKTITFESDCASEMSKSQATVSGSTHMLTKSKTSDSVESKESMLCDSKVSNLVNVVSVEESQIKSTVYEEVPKQEGNENLEDTLQEKDHFLLLNRSIEQCIPKDIHLQINREMKLVQDASKAGSYADVKINKSTSAHVEINKEQSHKRKTLLSQMVDLSNSENEQSFVDKTLGKIIDNVATDKALQKSQVENIDMSCEIVTNDEPGTSCVDDNRKDKSTGFGINKNIEKVGNDKVKVDIMSSQNMHEIFLNETKHKRQTSIDINEEDSKTERSAKNHKDLKELNDTNDVLDMLTEAANEIENNLLNSANVRPMNSQERLTKEYLDMMISDHPEEIDVVNEIDGAEDVSQTASKEVVKKRLTIAYLLDQSERIKSLSSTVNLVEKRSSNDNIGEKDREQEKDANILHNISVDNTSRNKTVRLSKEVVKTLQFEDESFQETTKANEKMNISVPKKCNYNEDTSIRKQNASRVIPETMKGDMNKINDLIRYLVKPNAESNYDKPDNSDESNVNKSISHMTLNQAKDIENVTANEDSTMDNFEPALSSTQRACTARKSQVCKTYSSDNSIRILGKTFDIDNPLNNVNLRYVTKIDKTVADRKFDALNPINNICLNVEMLNSKSTLNNTNTDKSRNRTETMDSRAISKVASVDKATGTKSKVIEDKEVNTAIAMKSNEELLDNTSCITLVDDSMNVSTSSAVSNQQCEGTVNYDTLKLPNQTVDVAYMVGIEQKGQRDCEGNRKRSLSPRRDDQQQNRSSKNLDLTPNPPRKIHKVSSSPALLTDIAKLQDHPHIAEVIMATTKSSELEGDTTDVDNAEPSIRVPHGATVPNLKHSVSEKSDFTEEKLSSTRMPALVTDTSEPNTDTMMPEFVTGDKSSKVEVTHADNDKRTEPGSPQNVDLCESRFGIATSADISMKEENLRRYQESMSFVEEYKIDLISEIDDLPFMGSWCCEWERRDADWSFLLLHRTVRVCVQFELADGTCVRADTPVASIDVQSLANDDRRSITSHCIAACVTALRSLATDGACARARDAPALLTRCARAVHDAAQWARDMQHASVHLAYKLSGSILTLQVANVPLRSVWDVSLRMVDGADGPRATSVRVEPVCSRARVPAEEVARALRDVEPGWRHVPRTMQKIFKHLKHKKKDDEMMALIR